MERSRVGDMSCPWEGEEGSHGIDISTTPSLTLLWKELQVLVRFFHTFVSVIDFTFIFKFPNFPMNTATKAKRLPVYYPAVL